MSDKEQEGKERLKTQIIDRLAKLQEKIEKQLTATKELKADVQTKKKTLESLI
jgi:hypothetical protein